MNRSRCPKSPRRHLTECPAPDSTRLPAAVFLGPRASSERERQQNQHADDLCDPSTPHLTVSPSDSTGSIRGEKRLLVTPRSDAVRPQDIVLCRRGPPKIFERDFGGVIREGPRAEVPGRQHSRP